MSLCDAWLGPQTLEGGLSRVSSSLGAPPPPLLDWCRMGPARPPKPCSKSTFATTWLAVRVGLCCELPCGPILG